MMKNLMCELLRAQEEVKRIQSVPHACREVDGGEGVEEVKVMQEGLTVKQAHRAAYWGREV
jgi:hypothetical protein